MKIAIVFDDLIQYGGAERLLLAVLEIWPEAPLFVPLASKEWMERLSDKTILETSFMQKLPLKKNLDRVYGALGLHVLAMESFDFSEYEVVLSISARFAHGVITKPNTKHICYMNSPGRMFWEPWGYFAKANTLNFLGPTLLHHRLWDYTASRRVDRFIANSNTIKARIRKYYGLESSVIFPFYEIKNSGLEQGWTSSSESEKLSLKGGKENPEGWTSYFLVISRLLPWKRIDIAIKSCGELSIPLKIIGDGPYMNTLKKIAREYKNIEFLGYVNDEEKARLIDGSMGLIQTQLEDFGIVPLEAMSLGKPVIAYGKGGVLDTVNPGKTGEFFCDQTKESLINVLRSFNNKRYDSSDCIIQAERFSKKNFQHELKDFVDNVYLEKL